MPKPTHSPRAALGLGFLKRPYNDVEIFVEDTASHNMWLFIFRRLLPHGTRLTSVNQLGGRSNVLKACANDQSDTARRRLYVIDGDFDFLLGRGPPRLRHLYRINHYCIENALLNEQSVTEFALRNTVGKSEADVVSALNYSAWISEIEKRLAPLFVIYAAAQSFNLVEHTAGRGVGAFFVNGPNGPELCSKKLASRQRAIARKICAAYGVSAFRRELRKIRSRSVRLKLTKIVSGKSYIGPLIQIRLGRVARFHGGLDQLLLNLAADFHPSWDINFSRRVRAI